MFSQRSRTYWVDFLQASNLLKGYGKVRQEEGTCVPGRGWIFPLKYSRQFMLHTAYNISLTYQQTAPLPSHSKNTVCLLFPPIEKYPRTSLSMIFHTLHCCEFNNLSGTASGTNFLHVHSDKYSSNILFFCNISCLPCGLYSFQRCLFLILINSPLICSRLCIFKMLEKLFKTLIIYFLAVVSM